MENSATPTNTAAHAGAADLDDLEAKALACVRSAPWKVQHPYTGATAYEVADASGLNQICGHVTKEIAQFMAAANPAVILQLIALARQASQLAAQVTCVKCEGRGSYAVMDNVRGLTNSICKKCGGRGKVLSNTGNNDAPTS